MNAYTGINLYPLCNYMIELKAILSGIIQKDYILA